MVDRTTILVSCPECNKTREAETSQVDCPVCQLDYDMMDGVLAYQRNVDNLIEAAKNAAAQMKLHLKDGGEAVDTAVFRLETILSHMGHR